jgi:hypothetical protein
MRNPRFAQEVLNPNNALLNALRAFILDELGFAGAVRWESRGV